MKRLLLYIVFTCFCLGVSLAQNVKDVEFFQDGKNVIVLYSLDEIANVTLHISTDGGKTFSLALKHVSGDVGKKVLQGDNRIIWNAFAERGEIIGEVIFEVRAEPSASIGDLNYVGPQTYLYLGANGSCQLPNASFNEDGVQQSPRVPLGYSFDWQMGVRIKQRLFLGAELGWHHLINAIPYTYKIYDVTTDYWYAPLGLNMKVYFPIQKAFHNSWHLSVSGGGYMGYGYYTDEVDAPLSLNSYDNYRKKLDTTWKSFSAGGYLSAGLGMDFRLFTFGLGYTALLGDVVGHMGYVKVGITLGRIN